MRRGFDYVKIIFLVWLTYNYRFLIANYLIIRERVYLNGGISHLIDFQLKPEFAIFYMSLRTFFRV